MANGHSPYASPTVVDPSLGPYYSQSNDGTTHHLPQPEVDDDLALRAELSRSLGLVHSTHESANTSHQHSPQPHDDLQQQRQQPHRLQQQQQQHQHAQPAPVPSQSQLTSPSQHAVNPDLSPEHHLSPPPGQHAADNNRDKRSKVSRACDAARRSVATP
jgi:hypothetical protein